MRILLISGIYPPDIGGPAKFIPELAKFLLESGNKVEVITLKDDDSQILISEFPVHYVKRQQVLFKRILKTTFLITWKSRSFDVIFANGLIEETAVSLFLTRKPGVVKIVSDPVWERAKNKSLTKDSREVFNQNKSRLDISFHRKLFNWSLSQFKTITCPSSELVELINFWNPKLNVVKIENGVESVPKSTQTKEFDVIAVSRLIKIKNIDILIKACKKSNSSLLIAGSGPEEKNLKTLALSLEANVRFLGHLDNHEVIDYLKKTRIFAQLSEYEGLSFSLLQAMSCGLPSIVSNVRGNTDVIANEINGLVVEATDVEMISKLIKDLIASPEKIKFLGDNARNLAREKYSNTEKLSRLQSTLMHAISYE